MRNRCSSESSEAPASHISLSGLRFSGFVDFWCEYDNLVILSEPQLWYAIGDHFNIGGEVEISYNFGGLSFTTGKNFNVMPCIGTKWVF